MNSTEQLTNNQDVVLTHLQSNKGRGITPLEALGVYGIYRLAPRINELRNKGYHIKTSLRTDHRGTRYARYFLEE